MTEKIKKVFSVNPSESDERDNSENCAKRRISNKINLKTSSRK